jgi:hypothetical protein
MSTGPAARRLAIRWLALGAYAALLFATAPPWPDDWDGVGFVESVTDFDMARLRPHPPGYPVYVALLRAAAAIVRDPVRACALVAVASGVVSIAFVWDAARRCAGERVAWMVAILVAVAPGVWRGCSGVGSEGPALACAAACAWGLTLARWGDCKSLGATVLGLGAGLGLGVRLSWAPLYLAALWMGARVDYRRALGTAVAACSAWAVPFVVWAGPAKIAALYSEHFGGHAARWGGTIITEPGFVRIVWVARDVFVDGLGVGIDPVGVAIAALLAVAALQAVVAWRAVGWRGWLPAFMLVAPYLVWIGLGQNVRDQPRHALPLVAMLAAGVALPVAGSRRAFALVGTLAVAGSIRTATDTHARRTVAPAGQQLVDLVRAQPAPKRPAVFGVGSVRFFETTDLASCARVAASLGEAHMELTHLNELPPRAWVTSELAGLDDARGALRPVADLCRPPRLDRARPCLGVYEWGF